MKKCKGCGILLQDSDVNGIGYVRSLEQDYCQRCFRLSHYGDTSRLKDNDVSNEKTIKMYERYKDALFTVIIDVIDLFCLDQDDLLDIFKDYRTLLIVNKMDLLPENISEYRMNRFLEDTLKGFSSKYPKLVSAIMTHYKDSSFNDLFNETLDDLNAKKVVFAGRSNAGKSTIINRLMSSKDLTVSLYPSTTLADNVIEYGDYTFIDTPGLLDQDNYSTYLDEESYKLMMIPRTIKPKVFQLDSDQSYFYEGALRVDVKPEKYASVSFFINSNNDIHRTKYDNADSYAEKHSDEFRIKTENTTKHEYMVKGSQMFVIKGLGMIKIKGNTDVCMHVDERVRIYLTKEVI